LSAQVSYILQDNVESYGDSYYSGSHKITKAQSGITLHKITKERATPVSRAEFLTQIQNVEAQIQLGTLKCGWCRSKDVGANHGEERKVEGEKKDKGYNTLGTHISNTFSSN